MNFNFDILKQAGINPGITASIVGVSRVTASHWCNGHTQPHRLLVARVSEYLRMVQAALDQGLLPLKDYPGRANVKAEISKALVTAGAAAKAA